MVSARSTGPSSPPKPPSRPAARVEVPPQERIQDPPRVGFLGTILTECEFDAEAREALDDLRSDLGTRVYDLARQLAERGRTAALKAEGLLSPDLFDEGPETRPSIERLRRSAATQWLAATLEGRFDSEFSRLVRHQWMPILLADFREEHPAPVLVGHLLDYAQGLLDAWIFEDTEENLVPAARRRDAVEKAFRIQRRLFGLES